MSGEPLPDVLGVALDVASRLESVQVSYVIGGSLASSVHGEPRSTMDVDVVADVRPESIARMVATLRPDYYVDADAVEAAVQVAGSFNAVAFELERLRKRVAVSVNAVPPRTLWVDTAEHTVLRKLEWFRRGGEVSDRQWRDVLAILAVQGETLDRGVLRRWAATLGVSDLLARSLGDA